MLKPPSLWDPMYIMMEIMEPLKVVKDMELLLSNLRAIHVYDVTFLVSNIKVKSCKHGFVGANKVVQHYFLQVPKDC